MGNHPFISVAMATYNGAKYLKDQLDSLVAQTELPFELVVCDDGSRDETVLILERFARTAPFAVRISRNRHNLGYARNFLRAASLCRGDWIAFCDQDDIWLPSKIAYVSAAVANTPDAALVVHQAMLSDATVRSTGRRYPRVPRRRILPRLSQPLWFKVPGFCCAFDAVLINAFPRKRMLPHFFNMERTQGHDRRITWLANVVGSTVVLKEPMAIYRRHAGNNSSLGSSSHMRSPATSSVAGVDFDNFRSHVAQEYADALVAFAERDVSASIALRLREGAVYYRRMSRWYALRAAMVRQPRWCRMVTLARMVVAGAYHGRGGAGFGLPSLIKDLATLPRAPRKN